MSRTKNRHSKGERPKIEPQRLLVWSDFPTAGTKEQYRTEHGVITVSGRAKNRVLRETHGLEIRTDEYSADNRSEGGFGAYGTYTLVTPITMIDAGVAA